MEKSIEGSQQRIADLGGLHLPPRAPATHPPTYFRLSCIKFRPLRLDVLPPCVATLDGESLLRTILPSQDITQLVMDSDEDFELGSPEKLEALYSSLLYEPLFTVIERNYVASPQLDICITERDRRVSRL
ncbi:hypothetical protein Pcinc_013776 [Petrolisthes cinctipes]|uniref:Uncharacterized protein n=1 Tax=Petrolisthes cinctipes TaxID=88211 RepID=A0AAE1FWB4_PETCI|nr:hypothetical protein Pcinc_013776 [Petrolisthes cinctipes]